MRFDLFFNGVSPFQFEGREAMEDERENVLEDLQPEEDPKSESADDKHKINSPILPTHGAATPDYDLRPFYELHRDITYRFNPFLGMTGGFNLGESEAYINIYF